jgi:hypothetical protein
MAFGSFASICFASIYGQGIQLSGQQRRPSIGLESLHRANLILEQRARETIHFARPDLLGLVSLPRMSSFFSLPGPDIWSESLFLCVACILFSYFCLLLFFGFV